MSATITRAEWLAKRDALAALLPRCVREDAAGEWARVSVDSLMTYEYGPCPPEPPSVTIGEWMVTVENGRYIATAQPKARRVFDSAIAVVFECVGYTNADDATVTCLLALRDGAK